MGGPAELVDIIKEWFFPRLPGCPLCGGSGSPRHLCPGCLQAWAEQAAGLQICPVCGRFGEVAGDCRECRNGRPSYIFARGVAPYEGPVREALHLFKFGGRRELAYPLGELMAALVAETYPRRGMAAVVPVPLHPAREQERRFNQAGLLAGVLAGCLGLPLVNGALRRIRETPSQTSLERAHRLTNLSGAFAPGEDLARLRGKWVLLVDDVYTTGATVEECSRTLLQAGTGGVYVVTLATSLLRTD